MTIRTRKGGRARARAESCANSLRTRGARPSERTCARAIVFVVGEEAGVGLAHRHVVVVGHRGCARPRRRRRGCSEARNRRSDACQRMSEESREARVDASGVEASRASKNVSKMSKNRGQPVPFSEIPDVDEGYRYLASNV